MYIKRIFPGESLEDAYRVRTNVFVDEQGFSLAVEFDDTDEIAHHVVVYSGEEPIATGRLFSTPEAPDTYHIGRIAVMKEYRSRGYGKVVMEALEEQARHVGGAKIVLGAQVQAQPFYEKLGYRSTGETFMDEHCRHVYMEKDLTPPGV